MITHIKVIPHSQQRYETCGDWWYDGNGHLQIRVSKLSDGRYEQLIGLHEYIEAILCDGQGVDEGDVTAFDLTFERNRKEGDIREPGDEKNAPYHKQHCIATALERLVAIELGVNWQEYEKEICGLKQ